MEGGEGTNGVFAKTALPVSGDMVPGVIPAWEEDLTNAEPIPVIVQFEHLKYEFHLKGMHDARGQRAEASHKQLPVSSTGHLCAGDRSTEIDSQRTLHLRAEYTMPYNTVVYCCITGPIGGSALQSRPYRFGQSASGGMGPR